MAKILRWVLLQLVVAAVAAAGPVYVIEIDTSPWVSTTGAIYFQFSPGIEPTIPASVAITGFVPLGNLIAGTPAGGWPAGGTGDFSGALDTPPLTLGNTSANNDYLQYLTWGLAASFRAEFSLGTPPEPPISGSSFLVGIYGPDGLLPLFGSPGGYVAGVDFNERGRFFSYVIPDDHGNTIATFVLPEPQSVLLMAAGLLGLAALARRLLTQQS
jgi:hypothetical protein